MIPRDYTLQVWSKAADKLRPSVLGAAAAAEFTLNAAPISDATDPFFRDDPATREWVDERRERNKLRWCGMRR